MTMRQRITNVLLHQNRPMTTAEIAMAMGVLPGNIQAMMNRMYRGGYLKSEPGTMIAGSATRWSLSGD